MLTLYWQVMLEEAFRKSCYLIRLYNFYTNNCSNVMFLDPAALYSPQIGDGAEGAQV